MIVDILQSRLNHQFNSCSEYSLKRIPFDAFESIIFGYKISGFDKSTITELVRQNENLSHLKLRVAKHTIFNKIEISDHVVDMRGQCKL